MDGSSVLNPVPLPSRSSPGAHVIWSHHQAFAYLAPCLGCLPSLSPKVVLGVNTQSMGSASLSLWFLGHHKVSPARCPGCGPPQGSVEQPQLTVCPEDSDQVGRSLEMAQWPVSVSREAGEGSHVTVGEPPNLSRAQGSQVGIGDESCPPHGAWPA